MKKVLSRKFYNRETLKVARELLGCFLVRKIGRKVIRAKITEVEAYIGEDDLACHARVGRTKRTDIMYGAAGHAYVYLIYGMYDLLNIITEKEDFPAAVLIRAGEIEGVPKKKTNGPGKLCRELRIGRSLNGWDMTRVPDPPIGGTVQGKRQGLWIERGRRVKEKNILATKRIGIDYAKHCADYLWRFSLTANLRKPPARMNGR